jgi:hypothetical protein
MHMGVAKVFRGSTIRVATIAIEYTIRVTGTNGARWTAFTLFEPVPLRNLTIRW